MKHRRVLLLFAKPPVQGRVKTRLNGKFGIENATMIHEQLLYSTARLINRCDFLSPQLWAGFDPEHSSFKNSLFTGWPVYLQHEGDLGLRMASASAEALGFHQSVVIVGSDCPALTEQYIEQAFTALEQGHEVVLGPAEDGGYVLVGLRRAIPEMFSNIDWGTDQVLVQSREQLKEAGVNWHELETLWDVDRPEDVWRWQAEYDAGVDFLAGLKAQ